MRFRASGSRGVRIWLSQHRHLQGWPRHAEPHFRTSPWNPGGVCRGSGAVRRTRAPSNQRDRWRSGQPLMAYGRSARRGRPLIGPGKSVVPRNAPAERSLESQIFFRRHSGFCGIPNREDVIARLATEPAVVREVLAHQRDPFGEGVRATWTLELRWLRHGITFRQRACHEHSAADAFEASFGRVDDGRGDDFDSVPDGDDMPRNTYGNARAYTPQKDDLSFA
jgi:hypothetical protein